MPTIYSQYIHLAFRAAHFILITYCENYFKK